MVAREEVGVGDLDRERTDPRPVSVGDFILRRCRLLRADETELLPSDVVETLSCFLLRPVSKLLREEGLERL